MCVSARRRFAASQAMPAAARSFGAAAVIAAVAPQGWSVADDIALVISEVATMALRVGATELEVEVEVHAGRVDVTLRDDGRSEDAAGPGEEHPADQPMARRLIEEVTTSWTARRTPDEGEVRLSVTCDPSATQRVECRHR
jgi:hypothetical protein